MPLTLDLIRHADAVPRDPGQADHERPLSSIGQRQVLVLGERLRERGSYPERVWCSPALRTRQTLAALGYDFAAQATFEPRIYEAELDTLLDLLSEIRPLAGRALLVGHNPGLQDLVNYALGPPAPEMVTSAHVRLELPDKPTRPLRGKGRLLDFWAP